MKFAVFTASTPQWTPAETVRILAGQGWDGVEWRITDQDDSPTPGFWAGNLSTWPLTGLEDRLADIAALTSGAGLAMPSLGGYARVADHTNVDRVLAAAAFLGAGRARVVMPRLADGRYRDLFAATRRDLEWVAGRAAEHGVTALVELHHGTITASASAAMRLVEGLDPAHVGVIHDIGNLIIEGYEDPLSAFDLLGDYLAHVHVKNVAWLPTGVDADGVRHWAEAWAPLRAGQADIGAYVQALRVYGYDGWITVEDFSTATPLEQRTADNLAYLTALVGRDGERDESS